MVAVWKLSVFQLFNELLESGYKLHHTATANHYISKETGWLLVDYDGRFGKGYKVYLASPHGSSRCYVKYFVKEGE